MSCGIYKITNNINRKIYIGQSANIEKRWREHINASQHETYYGHKKSLLYPALNKYGIDNFSFEIIEECDISELDERECYWINYYKSNESLNGYNILSGGQQGRQFNPEVFYQLWDKGKTIKEINSITGASYGTIENNLRVYKNYSVKESLKRSNIQACYKEENKVDKTPVYQYDLLGNYINEYRSISEATRAISRENKTRNSISHAINNSITHMAYGYLWSKEKVEKMKPYSTSNRKAVQCIETGEIFTSTREAARAYNMRSPGSIIACCQGKQKSAAKDLITKKPLHWQYYNNEG